MGNTLTEVNDAALIRLFYQFQCDSELRTVSVSPGGAADNSDTC